MFIKLCAWYGAIVLLSLAAAVAASAQPWVPALAAVPFVGAAAMVAVAAAARRFHAEHRRRLLLLRDAILAVADVDAPPPTLPLDDDLAPVSIALDQARNGVLLNLSNLDRTRKELQTILEALPEGVVAIDTEQKVLFANSSMRRLFGLPKRRFAGRKLWEVLRHPKLSDALEATFQQDDPFRTEFEILHPPRVLGFQGRSLSLPSGRVIVVILQDVTELRRLERLRQEFFANVSHELKTPLAAIKVFTETMLDDEAMPRPTLNRFLSRLDVQADRLHALVLDMLMLARVESQDHAFDIQPIDLHATVRHCVDSFAEDAAAKSIELSADLAAEEFFVHADAEGLLTILKNLVDNALKYTPEQGRVTVATTMAGDEVAIHVADTGVGIPPEDLGRVF
ncbi:MAG: sensor histidine kinase, partial [Planctomycetia bacterium]